jgi:hypothetical protein
MQAKICYCMKSPCARASLSRCLIHRKRGSQVVTDLILRGFPRALSALEKRPRLYSKTRVRIKVVLLLLAVLSAVGCASNSAKTEGKGTPSGMPEVTVDAPEKKVKATIRF